MSIATTVLDAAENKLVRSMGGYRKAAQIHSNISLLHEIQASNIHYDDFIEEEEYSNGTLSLNKIFKKKSTEVDLTGNN